MKQVKSILIAIEVAMILGVILLTFVTDWHDAEREGRAWMFQLLIVLCSLNAVVCQREQQEIEWNEEE